MCGFASTDERIKKKAVRSKTESFEQIELPIQSKFTRGDNVPTLLSSAPNLFHISQWGFNFDFSKTPIHNAQSEKLMQEGSAWHSPFKNLQLCIMPVNSFYEFNWQDPKGKIKVPYRIGLKDFPIFGIAGIYDFQENKLVTSTLTMDATGHAIGEIHNGGNNHSRSPLILTEDQWSSWLNATSMDTALQQIQLVDPKHLEYYSISRDFNKPSADPYSEKWWQSEPYRGDVQGSLF